MRSGARNVRVKFISPHLTHFGGVYLLHRFLQQIQLRTYLSERLRYPQRNNRYTLTEMLLALIYPMILGLERIEASALLSNNGVFQYLTGLPTFPNPATLRRFLLRSADSLLPLLQVAHNNLRKHFLSLPYIRSSCWIDFDSTAQTLYGNQEGVVRGYNPEHPGKKSYHPLIATEAHLKDCLGGCLRYGNVYTAKGVVDMLETVLSFLLPSYQIRVRADAGFYDRHFVANLSQKNIKFAIVAKMTKPIQHKLLGLRYRQANSIEAVAEFRYQPFRWKQEYRYVVLRRKVNQKEARQLPLFILNRYAYSVILTNLDLLPHSVFLFYRNRSAMERIIRTLKEDYPFATAPTRRFNANALYTELSLLAYNITNWFKRLCLPNSWQTFTLATLRHRLLLLPGSFTRTDNIPTLRFPKSNFYKDIFEYAEQKINQLDSLV